MATTRPLNSSVGTPTEMSDSQITLDCSDRHSDIRDSVGSFGVNILVNVESSSYFSTDTDEDGISLVPEWKDDGDDSICTHMYSCEDYDLEAGSGSSKLDRIPSTLQIPLRQGEMDGEDGHQLYLSPSSISYSQEHSNILRIEKMEGDFHYLPIVSIEPRPRLEKSRSGLDLDADQIDADTASTIRRNGFRRRLNTSCTDTGSTVTNPFLSTKPQKPSAPSRYTILRSASRFVLLLLAIYIVMLSVHDDVNNSRQLYRQQHQLLYADVNNRRQEIEFPITQVRDNFNDEGLAVGVLNTYPENGNMGKAKLPKFYFPKFDHSNTNANETHGSVSAGRPGGNLVMGRSHRSRPMFVPDIPLRDGGFQKPPQRFVFVPGEVDQREAQQRSKQRILDNNSLSSWTVWLASLSLIGMLCDTGWKGYQKYRITAAYHRRDPNR